MTDDAEGGIARSERRRASEIPGDFNAGQNLQRGRWTVWLRPHRAFALNDQQKSSPLVLIVAHTRAREEGGGNEENKATANQSPQTLSKKSLLPKERLRVGS